MSMYTARFVTVFCFTEFLFRLYVALFSDTIQNCVKVRQLRNSLWLVSNIPSIQIDKAHQYLQANQLDDNKLIVEYGRKCLQYRKKLSGSDNEVCRLYNVIYLRMLTHFQISDAFHIETSSKSNHWFLYETQHWAEMSFNQL